MQLHSHPSMGTMTIIHQGWTSENKNISWMWTVQNSLFAHLNTRFVAMLLSSAILYWAKNCIAVCVSVFWLPDLISKQIYFIQQFVNTDGCISLFMNEPDMGSFPIWSFPFSPFQIKFINSIFTYSFCTCYLLPGVGTPSTYLEYLLCVCFILQVGLSWKKYFWIKKLNVKLISGFNFFLANFNTKFINSIFLNKQFQNWISPMSGLNIPVHSHIVENG